MSQPSKEIIRSIVERAIDDLQPNPLGLKIAENGIHEVDGRWWAVVDVSVESPDRSKVWDSVAQLEDLIETENSEHPDWRVLVTAA